MCGRRAEPRSRHITQNPQNIHSRSKFFKKKGPEKGMNNEKRLKKYFFSTFPGGYAPGVAQSTPPASTTAPNATAKSHPFPHHHSPSSDTLATPSSSFSNPPPSSSNTPLSSSPWYTVAEQNSEPHRNPYPLPRKQQARQSPVR